ncbi:MAG TPA: FtsQ-type POTRA domain-containing protein [Motilibacteraceae bacterium]|nr:FtsQ-type POTRA domain-containing protein [Motilibacteraceae bacterium]
MVVVAAVVALAWAVLAGPLLVVRAVRVQGLPAAAAPAPGGLTPDDVTAAAEVPMGGPMLRLDTAAVRRRVADLPSVAGVDVARAWPGTIEITVQERTPAAVVRAGSSWTLVDASGVAFATVPRRPAGLPLLTTPTAALGAAPPAPLTAAVAVVSALPKALASQVTQVSAQTPDHVVLSLTRGRTVVWGDASRPQRKALVAQALLGQSTPKVTTVDVSAPDAPTTR